MKGVILSSSVSAVSNLIIGMDGKKSYTFVFADLNFGTGNRAKQNFSER
jgi:hypothetical protein